MMRLVSTTRGNRNGTSDATDAESSHKNGKMKKHGSNRSIDASDKTSVTAAIAESLNAVQLNSSLEEASGFTEEDLPLPPPPPPPTVSYDSSSMQPPFANETSSNQYAGPFRLPGAIEAPRNKSNFGIEPNTPAHDALTANRNIHVSKLSKMSRRAQIPKVRKAVKKVAAFKGPNQSKRGKPPRVPHQASEDGGFSGRGLGLVAYSVGAGDFPSTSIIQRQLGDLEEVSLESDGGREDDEESVEPAGWNNMERILNGILKMEPNDESSQTDDKSNQQKSILMKRKPNSIEKRRKSKTGKDEPAVRPDDTPLIERTSSTDTKSSKELKSQRLDLGHRDEERLSTLVWRRDKKKKKKKDRNYVKGKVIDGHHELYTLSLAVMLGLRTSISRTNGRLGLKNNRWLDTHDFMAVEKYTFPPNGDKKTDTPPHELAHTFKIKDYSPMAFAYIRKMFGINEYDFLASVCGNANYIEFISNAKSGQFFFYSSDGKYMIKTMTNAESKFLRRILPHYFRHCAENPNTLMTKFYGMYRVKMYHLRRNVKFLIMNSVFDTDKILQTFFDVKGSITGRIAKPGEDVKKDNDVRKFLPDEAFKIPCDTRERLREQIRRDSNFFKKMKIMDYSMLIAIHYIPPKNKISNVSNSTLSKRSNSSRSSPFPSMDSSRLLDIDSDGSVLSAFQMESITSFDEDDDCSLLEDRGRRMSFDEDSGIEVPSTLEKRKRETTKKRFWPFHLLYSLQGKRLLSPHPDDTSSVADGIHGISPKFVPPISNRVDGGLLMDTTGIDLPKEYTYGNGKIGTHEGKIFYMGIIDILQQFNARKRIEAKLRRISGSGWADASCVHPNLYADRFVSFFNEYTTSSPDTVRSVNEEQDEGDNQIIDNDDSENVEEITFQDSDEHEVSSDLFSDTP